MFLDVVSVPGLYRLCFGALAIIGIILGELAKRRVINLRAGAVISVFLLGGGIAALVVNDLLQPPELRTLAINLEFSEYAAWLFFIIFGALTMGGAIGWLTEIGRKKLLCGALAVAAAATMATGAAIALFASSLTRDRFISIVFDISWTVMIAVYIKEIWSYRGVPIQKRHSARMARKAT